MKEYKTINLAYNSLLNDIYNTYDYEVNVHEDSNLPNAGVIREKLNYSFKITDPEETLIFKSLDSKRDKIINDYLNREMEIFDAGIISSEVMKYHSKIWGEIKNYDGTINANYGYMVHHLRDTENGISQFEYALRTLIKDKNSRQAYIHFNRVKDQVFTNNDHPCTMYGHFIIRDNILYFMSYMRANDIIYGTPYNLGYFNRLSKQMFIILKRIYPELKKRMLIHNVGSIHYYVKHTKRLEKMLGL